MWISRQMSKRMDEPSAQTGKSTLNSNGCVEVVSTGVNRDVELFSPYGYFFSLPPGENVLLSKCDGQQVGLGVRLDKCNVKTGEIKIISQSGAYIHLKQDGSVVINGLKITKNGEMK